MYKKSVLNEAPFDLIWFTGVLYHNPEQFRFVKRLFNILKLGGMLVIETATSRKIGMDKKFVVVEIWDEIKPRIKKKYHLSKNISHFPKKSAIKNWLGLVGLESIISSNCYRTHPLLGLNRAAFFATKPFKANIKNKQTYYNIANLKYEVGESK